MCSLELQTTRLRAGAALLLTLTVLLGGCLSIGPSSSPAGDEAAESPSPPSVDPTNSSGTTPEGSTPNSSVGWHDPVSYHQQRLVAGHGNVSIELLRGGRAFSPDDADINAAQDRVAISYPDGFIEVWSFDGRLETVFSNHVMNCTSRGGLVRFLGADALVTTCDTTVLAFGVDGSFLWSQDLRHDSAIIESMDASADGNTVAVRFAQPEVRVWDRVSNNSAFVPVEDPAMRLIDLSADGRTLAVTGAWAKFYKVDAATGTYAMVAAVQNQGEATLCADGEVGLVGALDAWGARRGAVSIVDLKTGNHTDIDVSEHFGTGGLNRGSPYQQAKLFASPECGHIGMLNTLSWIWSEPNSTAVFGYLSVALVRDRSAPNVSSGLGTGPASFPAAPDIWPTSGTGSIWVTRLFIADDGSAISISTNSERSRGGGDVRVWMTHADPGATLPTIDTETITILD